MKTSIMDKLKELSFKDIMLRYGIYVGFVAILITFSQLNTNFFTAKNFINVLEQYSYYIVCAVGMSFVILVGGVNLAAGSMIACGGVISAMVMINTKNVALGCTIAIALPVVVSLICGLMIVKLRLPSFIVTLALQNILKGIAYSVTSNSTITGLPKAFTKFSFKETLGISNLIFVVLIVVLVASYVLRFTKYGRQLYAVGGSRKAAKIMGINVELIEVSAYVIAGFLTGISTLLLTSYMASANPSVADNVALESIAACVIGGYSVSGGEGKLVGALIGALIFGLVKNGLNLVGLDSFYQLVATGSIIFVAAAVDAAKNRVRN